MSNHYRPRRQSSRWLDGDCPAGVLAIYDDPRYFDRFTVFYTDVIPGPHGEPWIGYRGMSEHPTMPTGFGCGGEMEAYKGPRLPLPRVAPRGDLVVAA